MAICQSVPSTLRSVSMLTLIRRGAAIAVALGFAISGCSNGESRQVGELDYYGACWKRLPDEADGGSIIGVTTYAANEPDSTANEIVTIFVASNTPTGIYNLGDTDRSVVRVDYATGREASRYSCTDVAPPPDRDPGTSSVAIRGSLETEFKISPGSDAKYPTRVRATLSDVEFDNGLIVDELTIEWLDVSQQG